MKLLLVGNPNAGKSAVFSQITGTYVISSNYPGTTVSYTRGTLAWNDFTAEVIDVPGIYSLCPSSKADEVATEMVGEGDIVLNVADATHLERSLYLTLELVELRKPLVLVLNMWDETRHKGISIDVERLSRELGVPVIPVSAMTGEGFNELLSCVRDLWAKHSSGSTELAASNDHTVMIYRPDQRKNAACTRRPSRFQTESTDAASGTAIARWRRVGEIVSAIQTLSPRQHNLLEKVSDATLNPVAGPFIAIAVIIACLYVVITAGEALIEYIFDPLFSNFYSPLLIRLSSALGSSGLVHDILIGQVSGTSIDFIDALGLLSTGIYVPLAMVLPYVAVFYLVLGFLEDLGYLARLAVLADSLMHRVGLHGHAVVSMILGAGCNVPGVLSIRCLECRRERFIAGTLVSVCIPCMAQTAVIFGLVGRHGAGYLALVFCTLLAVWIILGLLLDKLFPGQSPTVLLEVPDLRWPQRKSLCKKLTARVRSFFIEAVPFVLLGLLIVAVVYRIGLSEAFSRVAAPLVSNLWGLPADSATAFIVGLLRKDLAVGIMDGFDLTAGQMATAAVVLTLYFPCLATFSVLLSELGLKDMAKAAAIMVATAAIAGTVVRLIVA